MAKITLNFQKRLQQHSNHLVILSAILIVLGYLGKYGVNQIWIWNSTMIIASIIGFIPVAIHAYQAIKVKQISIDLLVSIAVIGALFIGEYEESAIVTFLFAFGGFFGEKTLEKRDQVSKNSRIWHPAQPYLLMAKKWTLMKLKLATNS